MMGRTYVRISKTLIWASSLLICSFLLTQDQPYYFVYSLHLIPPLLVQYYLTKVMTLLAFEIGTHFSELLGTVGDTIVLLYAADVETNGLNGIPEDIHEHMKNNTLTEQDCC